MGVRPVVTSDTGEDAGARGAVCVAAALPTVLTDAAT